MIAWLILGIYGLGYLLTWRLVVHSLAWQIGRPNGEDIIMSMIFGTLICGFWPVIQMGRVVKLVYARRGDDILAIIEPRSVRRSEKQKAQTRRIEELERELNIR